MRKPPKITQIFDDMCALINWGCGNLIKQICVCVYIIYTYIHVFIFSFFGEFLLLTVNRICKSNQLFI